MSEGEISDTGSTSRSRSPSVSGVRVHPGDPNKNNNALELKQLKDDVEELRKKIKQMQGHLESSPLRDIAIPRDEIEDVRPHMIERRCLSGHQGKVYAVQWAENSKDLVSVDKSGTLITWDAFRNTQMHSVNTGGWLMTAAFSPDGQLVACAGSKGVISVYTRNLEESTEMTEHDGSVSCCRFIDDGTLLSTSTDSRCILWDIEQKTAKQFFDDHSGEVLSCDVSPTSPWLFMTSSTDTTARYWDARAPKPMIKTFSGHQSDVNSVAFFPSGHGFGTGCEDSACRFFDLRALRQVNHFSDNSITCGVTSVAFSKSGRLLFGGYDDYKAYAWDTVLGKMVQKLSGHTDRISSLAVSKDGSALVTAGWDCNLKVWAT